jgi:vacuolar-type H+-ATPase subunit I/STV1
MLSKLLYLLFAIFIAVTLNACGGNKEEATQEDQDVAIENVTDEEATPSIDDMLTKLDQLANAFLQAKEENQPIDELLNEANDLKSKLEATEKSEEQTAKYDDIVEKLK